MSPVYQAEAAALVAAECDFEIHYLTRLDSIAYDLNANFAILSHKRPPGADIRSLKANASLKAHITELESTIGHREAPTGRLHRTRTSHHLPTMNDNQNWHFFTLS